MRPGSRRHDAVDRKVLQRAKRDAALAKKLRGREQADDKAAVAVLGGSDDDEDNDMDVDSHGDINNTSGAWPLPVSRRFQAGSFSCFLQAVLHACVSRCSHAHTECVAITVCCFVKPLLPTGEGITAHAPGVGRPDPSHMGMGRPLQQQRAGRATERRPQNTALQDLSLAEQERLALSLLGRQPVK